MNERIHKVLDGELPRAALTPEEQSILASYEATIEAAARVLSRHPAPDVTADVMARIAAAETAADTATDAAAPVAPASAGRSPLARALDWLWTPRPIALRPAWALGALGLFVLVAVLPTEDEARMATPPAPDAAAAGAPASEIYVHFRLDAPDASSVQLAGDFTDWKPAYELHESQPGVWTVIVPLRAGVHDYAFVIDGEHWTPDPLATHVDDGFGGQNSRLSLLPPEQVQA